MQTRVAIILHSREKRVLDCRDEGHYKDLALALESRGYALETITWTKDNLDEVASMAREADGVLVWVDPVDREVGAGSFENLLRQLHREGKYIGSHPDVIGRIGTKEVLYTIAGTEWVNDAYRHEGIATLKEIRARLDAGEKRVTKQFRGNGGLEVYKLEKADEKHYRATEANTSETMVSADFDGIAEMIGRRTTPDNPTIEVPWNDNLANGVVRCYFCVDKVVGFGYQEINALYPMQLAGLIRRQRFYLTENCGLFRGLREKAENCFVRNLTEITGVSPDQLPLIWDADFFINDLRKDDYELCEINASCVSPFPPSAVGYMCDEVDRRLGHLLLRTLPSA